MTIADVKDMVSIAGPILGFFAAWGLFELTERRKVRLAERALRTALVAELEHAEGVLASIVTRFAHFADTPAAIQQLATEWRWLTLGGGRQRMQALSESALPEYPPGFVERVSDLSDQQLVALLAASRVNVEHARLGPKVILPIVDAALAGRTSGFTSREIQALSSVRWHEHGLAEGSRWAEEFLRMTFTITDDAKHAGATQNLESRTKDYAQRAGSMLAAVRSALQILGGERAGGRCA
jgi:hypothetical protein